MQGKLFRRGRTWASCLDTEKWSVASQPSLKCAHLLHTQGFCLPLSHSFLTPRLPVPSGLTPSVLLPQTFPPLAFPPLAPFSRIFLKCKYNYPTTSWRRSKGSPNAWWVTICVPIWWLLTLQPHPFYHSHPIGPFSPKNASCSPPAKAFLGAMFAWTFPKPHWCLVSSSSTLSFLFKHLICSILSSVCSMSLLWLPMVSCVPTGTLCHK